MLLAPFLTALFALFTRVGSVLSKILEVINESLLLLLKKGIMAIVYCFWHQKNKTMIYHASEKNLIQCSERQASYPVHHKTFAIKIQWSILQKNHVL